MSCTSSLLSLVLLLCASQDDKKTPPDPKPRIAMSLPLAVTPATTKIVLRGLNLDQATEVKTAEPVEGATVAVKSKAKASIPKETDPAVYGDTQVELTVKIPAGLEKLALIVVNAAGQTSPYEIPIFSADRLIAEKEPNGGFAQSMPVDAGKVVQGEIGQALDVDVFKVQGKAGEAWIFEVEAHRRGSVLDPMLYVHDAGGHLLAARDDGDSSRDPVVRLKLKADGPVYVTVMDAHNQGGATHPYLLYLRRAD